MSNNITTALSALSREDLLSLLTQALTTGEVTQAPTEDARPVCGRTKSSDGEPCTRKATQDDGACKSHTGDWDNAEATAKAQRSEEFVSSLRERAQGKATGTRADNKALAAALRAQGAQPNGEVWTVAKAALGEGLSVDEAATLATA